PRAPGCERSGGDRHAPVADRRRQGVHGRRRAAAPGHGPRRQPLRARRRATGAHSERPPLARALSPARARHAPQPGAGMQRGGTLALLTLLLAAGQGAPAAPGRSGAPDASSAGAGASGAANAPSAATTQAPAASPAGPLEMVRVGGVGSAAEATF